jgi:hypothetical protein
VEYAKRDVAVGLDDGAKLLCSFICLGEKASFGTKCSKATTSNDIIYNLEAIFTSIVQYAPADGMERSSEATPRGFQCSVGDWI